MCRYMIPVEQKIAALLIQDISEAAIPKEFWRWVPNQCALGVASDCIDCVVLPLPGVQVLLSADTAHARTCQRYLHGTSCHRCDDPHKRCIPDEDDAHFFGRECVRPLAHVLDISKSFRA